MQLPSAAAPRMQPPRAASPPAAALGTLAVKGPGRPLRGEGKRREGTEVPGDAEAGWGREGKGTLFLASWKRRPERSKQSSHMYCRSLCKGVRRGAGERQHPEREQTGEVRNPASPDLPTRWLPRCAQSLISQSLESPQEGRSRTPRGGAVEGRMCTEAQAPGVGRDRLQLAGVQAAHFQTLGVADAFSTAFTAKAPGTPNRQGPSSDLNCFSCSAFSSNKKKLHLLSAGSSSSQLPAKSCNLGARGGARGPQE